MNNANSMKPLNYKHKKTSTVLAEEIKKKEEEFRKVREMLDHSNSHEQEELNKLLNRNKKKTGVLKPVMKHKATICNSKTKANADPHKRLIDQMQMLVTSDIKTSKNTIQSAQVKSDEIIINRNQTMEISSQLNKSQEFRKTFVKTEKISINCEPFEISANSTMNKSIGLHENYENNLKKEEEYILNIGDYDRVNEFLGSINLSKYFELFIEHGFNDLNKLRNNLNEENLKEFQIPYGHRLKILKALGNQIDSIEDNLINNDDMNMRPISNNNYEDLPVGKEVLHNNTKDEDFYDEKIQAKLFQEAVEEFRKTNLDIQKGSNIVVGVNTDFSDKPLVNNIKFSTNIIPIIEENNTETEIKNFLPINQQKFSCWECYKIIVKEFSVQSYDKIFCNYICEQNFVSKSYLNCANTSCNKQIEKNKSLLFRTKNFCSESCLNEDKNFLGNLMHVMNESRYDPMDDF